MPYTRSTQAAVKGSKQSAYKRTQRSQEYAAASREGWHWRNVRSVWRHGRLATVVGPAAKVPLKPCEVPNRSWAVFTLDEKEDLSSTEPYVHVPRQSDPMRRVDPHKERVDLKSYDRRRIHRAVGSRGVVVAEIDEQRALWMLQRRCTPRTFIESLCFQSKRELTSNGYEALYAAIQVEHNIEHVGLAALRAAAQDLSTDYHGGIFVFCLRDCSAMHFCGNGVIITMRFHLAFMTYMSSENCIGLAYMPRYYWPLERPNFLVGSFPVSPDEVAASIVSVIAGDEPVFQEF